MDAITTAIVAALANMSNDIIKDGYNALKSALKEMFGSEGDLIDAVEKLESKPDSEGRKATLQEEVANAKANDNSKIVQLAQELLEKLKEQPGEKTTIAQTINAKYAATSGTGNASMTVGNDVKN
jgi:beta-phosphoglucomutase-like phosphatase (HAD superfamily)